MLENELKKERQTWDEKDDGYKYLARSMKSTRST